LHQVHHAAKKPSVGTAIPKIPVGSTRSWNGKCADAALRVLVENGNVTGMAPKEVWTKYELFQKYDLNTFRSAITNLRKSINKATANRASYNRSTGKSSQFQVQNFSSSISSIFFH
jgi:hypothetical protein